MAGVGPSLQDRQWEWVRCLECMKDLAVGLLATNIQDQYETSWGPQWEATEKF